MRVEYLWRTDRWRLGSGEPRLFRFELSAHARTIIGNLDEALTRYLTDSTLYALGRVEYPLLGLGFYVAHLRGQRASGR